MSSPCRITGCHRDIACALFDAMMCSECWESFSDWEQIQVLTQNLLVLCPDCPYGGVYPVYQTEHECLACHFDGDH